MFINRHGDPCPLCRTLLLLDVLQERFAQSDFPYERVIARHCRGCETTRPERWRR